MEHCEVSRDFFWKLISTTKLTHYCPASNIYIYIWRLTKIFISIMEGILKIFSYDRLKRAYLELCHEKRRKKNPGING